MTKEIFVSVIESIREQVSFDKGYARTLAEHFGVEDMACYDNSRIIGSLIALLQLAFPKIDAFCEIEHYCFTLDFGKNGEDYESPEELYDRLFFQQRWINEMEYFSSLYADPVRNSKKIQLYEFQPEIFEETKTFISTNKRQNYPKVLSSTTKETVIQWLTAIGHYGTFKAMKND